MTADGKNRSSLLLLGVDTGGTFTDFVLLDDAGLAVHKCLSTPDRPETAIVQGIEALSASRSGLAVVHGSTVATNAVLEGKGVRTVYVANAGLADVLTIGRQARRELYNLQPKPQAPPVSAELCLEVDQRTGADGGPVVELDPEQVSQLVEKIKEIGAKAVAINLLFSFLDDSAERAIEQALPEDLFVSRSSYVLPEYREYERGIATWLNASVGPKIGAYVGRLQKELGEVPLAVMHSAAGTVDAAQASTRAVNLLLSGPAGGLLGARFIGRLAGRERLMTFDMGGTSTDVALIDGAIRLTGEGTIGGYPVAVPMVDMHTIGAGGGSIAYVDAGGLLNVGPESAGADPGPACYGQGGEQTTVTDANLILGRLPADTKLGGRMQMDIQASRDAMQALAADMDVSVEEAAEGVIRVANEHMAKALRVISVHKGEDPREYSLLCFGGAGGLHVCALAEALGMTRALVPIHAGVLSALGMLAGRRSRELSQSVVQPLGQVNAETLEQFQEELQSRGLEELTAEGVAKRDIETTAALDLRYVGQSYTLKVDFESLEAAAEQFHVAHEERYGHRLDLPVELVNLRLSLRGPEPEIELPKLEQAQGEAEAHDRVSAYGIEEEVELYEREALRAGHELQGPAIVREAVSTTFIAPGWVCEVDDYGNLLLHLRQ